MTSKEESTTPMTTFRTVEDIHTQLKKLEFRDSDIETIIWSTRINGTTKSKSYASGMGYIHLPMYITKIVMNGVSTNFVLEHTQEILDAMVDDPEGIQEAITIINQTLKH